MAGVYTLPNGTNVDGLNLFTPSLQYVLDAKIDDIRLNNEDTVLISSYPRSGSTWLSHILSLMLATEENYESTKSQPLMDRVPCLEWTRPKATRAEVEKIDSVPAPRAVKTHLPFRFIKRWITEDQVKTIIITRNPKDTLVSLYHFYLARKVLDFTGTWSEFFAHVQAENTLYGDQCEWLRDWNDNRDKGQLLFLHYEDMKQDPLSQIKLISAFLKLDISEARMQQIVVDTSINQMQGAAAFKYPALKPGNEQLVRTGQVGDWKQYFTVEQNDWFDDKYQRSYEAFAIGSYYQ